MSIKWKPADVSRFESEREEFLAQESVSERSRKVAEQNKCRFRTSLCRFAGTTAGCRREKMGELCEYAHTQRELAYFEAFSWCDARDHEKCRRDIATCGRRHAGDLTPIEQVQRDYGVSYGGTERGDPRAHSSSRSARSAPRDDGLSRVTSHDHRDQPTSADAVVDAWRSHAGQSQPSAEDHGRAQEWFPKPTSSKPKKRPENASTKVCELCGTGAMGLDSYEIHVKGKKHLRAVREAEFRMRNKRVVQAEVDAETYGVFPKYDSHRADQLTLEVDSDKDKHRADPRISAAGAAHAFGLGESEGGGTAVFARKDRRDAYRSPTSSRYDEQRSTPGPDRSSPRSPPIRRAAGPGVSARSDGPGRRQDRENVSRTDDASQHGSAYNVPRARWTPARDSGPSHSEARDFSSRDGKVSGQRSMSDVRMTPRDSGSRHESASQSWSGRPSARSAESRSGDGTSNGFEGTRRPPQSPRTSPASPTSPSGQDEVMRPAYPSGGPGGGTRLDASREDISNRPIPGSSREDRSRPPASPPARPVPALSNGQPVSDAWLDQPMSREEWREMETYFLNVGGVDALAFKAVRDALLSPAEGVGLPEDDVAVLTDMYKRVPVFQDTVTGDFMCDPRSSHRSELFPDCSRMDATPNEQGALDRASLMLKSSMDPFYLGKTDHDGEVVDLRGERGFVTMKSKGIERIAPRSGMHPGDYENQWQIVLGPPKAGFCVDPLYFHDKSIVRDPLFLQLQDPGVRRAYEKVDDQHLQEHSQRWRDVLKQ